LKFLLFQFIQRYQAKMNSEMPKTMHSVPTRSERKRRHGRKNAVPAKAPVPTPATTKPSEAELEEMARHYGVWEELAKLATELEKMTMHSLIASHKMEEVANILYTLEPSYVAATAPRGDRFSQMMAEVFGARPKLVVVSECTRVFQAYKKLYMDACDKANAYRKEHNVCDTKDITPFDFNKVNL